jgi:hypothetical protein
VRVTARPGRHGTVAYWVRSLIAGESGPASRVDNIYAPAVVVVSSAGEEYVLQHTGTYRQAKAAYRRLETDRCRLGDAAFCQRYGLPGRFAD